MARNIDDIISELRPAQRKKVEARSVELIAEEMTLQQLKKGASLPSKR